MTLQFFVNNQTLSLNPAQKNIKIASDSKNYLKANFIFQSNEWKSGEGHYAIFTHNGKAYKRFLGIEQGVKSNECFVPPQVIKEGTFTVSVFCGDLITSTLEEIQVLSSGYTTDTDKDEEDEPIVPGDDWEYAQALIFTVIDKYLDNNEFIIDTN